MYRAESSYDRPFVPFEAASILREQRSNFSFPQKSSPVAIELERCFCGLPVDEDSIYCSVKCGREDAMAALTSSSSSNNDENLPNGRDFAGGEAMSRGGSSSSHYRRIESAEAEKEAEKARREGRESSIGIWRYQKSKSKKASTSSSISTPLSSSSPSPVPSASYSRPQTPLFEQSSRLDSLRSLPMSRNATHCPSTSTSTTGSAVPSFSSHGSSSQHSYTSSQDSSIYDGSPLSPAFPMTSSSHVPKFHYDHYGSLDDNSYQKPLPSHHAFQFPRTPSPKFGNGGGGGAHIEILDAFYDLDKSPTPTVMNKKTYRPHSPPNFVRAMFQEEERDVVPKMTRVRSERKTHHKGKLSFDDVVKLMA